MGPNDTLDDFLLRNNWTNRSFNFTIPDAADTETVGSIYGLRFVPYTVLLVGSVIFNLLSVTAMMKIRGHRTVHHTLLLNLSMCDMSGSMLLWMYYNSPIIFAHFEVTRIEHCLFIVCVLCGSFILSLCLSSLSLLSLALNQYLAICNPLISTTTITRGKACCCILVIWLVSVTCAMMPGFSLLIRSQYSHCRGYVSSMGETSLEVCTYVMAGLILVIVVLYGRIYREIVRYRMRTPVMTNRRPRSDDAEHNYKAFVTILLLSSTLIFFWLPFMVFHFITAHVDITQIPDSVLYAKFYVIDFMPMLIYITDPIIYGIRMREIRDAYHRLFAKLMPCLISEPSRATFRGSVRFTTLDTTTV